MCLVVIVVAPSLCAAVWFFVLCSALCTISAKGHAKCKSGYRHFFTLLSMSRTPRVFLLVCSSPSLAMSPSQQFPLTFSASFDSKVEACYACSRWVDGWMDGWIDRCCTSTVVSAGSRDQRKIAPHHFPPTTCCCSGFAKIVTTRGRSKNSPPP